MFLYYFLLFISLLHSESVIINNLYLLHRLKMKPSFQATQQNLPKEVKESRYRWVIVLLYITTSTLTAAVNYSFSPVTNILNQYYGATSFEIYYISVSFSASFLLLSLPSSYLIERKGMKFLIGVNVFLLTLGAGIR